MKLPFASCAGEKPGGGQLLTSSPAALNLTVLSRVVLPGSPEMRTSGVRADSNWYPLANELCAKNGEG